MNLRKNDFSNFERQFDSNSQLMLKYSEFISDYLKLNYIELVPRSQLHSDNHYLSHHAVFKDASSTTYLKVVFDASRKTMNGLSLNDDLRAGPTIQHGLYLTY